MYVLMTGQSSSNASNMLSRQVWLAHVVQREYSLDQKHSY